MEWSVDRRLILAGGGVLALAAGLIAAAMLSARRHAASEVPPASQAGLMVQTGRDDDIKLDPRRPLRCFVAGRLIGELPLGECAKRNGVASGALDVGLDPSGALAASNGDTSQITPLPPIAEEIPQAAPGPSATSAAATAASLATPARAGSAACWRYAGGTWNALARPMSLSACVMSLYDGECERPGAAAYGRWSDRTLRLVSGRIEISHDNRTFRTLAEQSANCGVPPVELSASGPPRP